MAKSTKVQIFSTEGMFGSIQIFDLLLAKDLHARCLYVGNHCLVQGGVLKSTSKKKFSRVTGITIPSYYCHEFVKILLSNDDIKNVTMVGLGAGSICTTLLALLPELKIRVIEIDPVIVGVTRSYFPDISKYERQGRLEIITADAVQWIQQNKDIINDESEVLMLDAFEFSEDPEISGTGVLDDILPMLVDIKCNVVANFIAIPNSCYHERFREVFDSTGLSFIENRSELIAQDVVQNFVFSTLASQPIVESKLEATALEDYLMLQKSIAIADAKFYASENPLISKGKVHSSMMR